MTVRIRKDIAWRRARNPGGDRLLASRIRGAHQARCRDRKPDGAEALAGIDADRVLCLQYEQFVDAPQKYTQRIVDFLEIDVDPTAIASSVAGVSRRSVGKGRRQLDDETIASIMPILESVPRQPEVEAPNPSQEVAA